MKTKVRVGIFFLCILGWSDAFGQICPLNPPKGPVVVYRNKYGPGWNKSGLWSSTTITQVQTPGQGNSAEKSLLVGFLNPWGGGGVYEDNLSAYIAGRNALSFRIRKENGNGDVLVGLHRSLGTMNIDVWVNVSHYLVPNQSTPFVAGQWYSVRIPFTAFQMTDSYIQGIVFQSSVADDVYLDDIWIVEDFKLPLSGGKNWLLTTEIGDQGCNGNSPPLPSHTGNNYFSLDFDDRSQSVGQESNVSVFAVGGGKVLFAGFVDQDGTRCNGYHVILDHDYDGNVNTGISTRYLHLVEGSLTVVTGDTVSQGAKLGVLGDTGSGLVSNSETNESCGNWGTHIHIGFRSTNNGSSNVGELDNVTMEGKKLSEYTATCSGGNPTRYFPSSNAQ